MQLNKDISDALQLLDEIEKHCTKSEPPRNGLNKNTREDLHLLRSVLENPIFRSIVTIEDSLEVLRKELVEDPAMTSDDFDITPSGDLVVNDRNEEAIYKEVSDDEGLPETTIYDKNPAHFERRRSIEGITFDFYKDSPLCAQYNFPRRSISLLDGAQEIPMQDIDDLSRIISNTNRLQSRSLSTVPFHSEPSNIACKFLFNAHCDSIPWNLGKTELDGPYLAFNPYLPRDTISDVLSKTPKKRREKSNSLDTVIDFSLWDKDIQMIVLRKTGKGLGFSICEHRDKADPKRTAIVIKNLVPNGMAKLDGRLMPGDRIMSVNDIKFENISLEDAVKVLKGISYGLVRIGVVKLLVNPDDDQ